MELDTRLSLLTSYALPVLAALTVIVLGLWLSGKIALVIENSLGAGAALFAIIHPWDSGVSIWISGLAMMRILIARFQQFCRSQKTTPVSTMNQRLERKSSC